ncbi:NIPSNAP family protein [Paraburkholderia sp. 1N]|uniref:NIPSNAP family protein n=1 Tax=Paraburkholderia solitsugae TaxID=2675748 RepID=A0ABX2BSB3_9BURK|nr:NIPSNAP family protein [Paraburkholderia solitsugae]NPT42836.1 NIPSNAP family protein [Paraburkholderia solitsugae]
MIYELRQYTPNPGKESIMRERFLKTLPLFEKHGLTLVFATNPVEDPRQLWYVLSFESEPARVAAWAAFLADPEWLEIKKQSEVGGPVLQEIKKFILAGDAAVVEALTASKQSGL